MEKMAMIIYNEAIDVEVMSALEACAVKNYTKVMGVFGRGCSSGKHLGNDIWPGRNNILYVACAQEEAEKLLACVRELKKRFPREGVKAFILSVDDKS